MVHCSEAPKNYSLSNYSSAISHDSFCNFCEAPGNRTGKWPAQNLTVFLYTVPRARAMSLLIHCYILQFAHIGVNWVFLVNSETDAWDWMMIFRLPDTFIWPNSCRLSHVQRNLARLHFYLPFHFWCNRIGMRGKEYIRVPHWESIL